MSDPTKPATPAEERARGEMPFLDHLEELRWRLIKCLARERLRTMPR